MTTDLDIKKSILFAILSTVFLTLSDICIRFIVVYEYHPAQITFFRSVFSFIPIFIMFRKQFQWHYIKSYKGHLHSIRAFLGFVSIIMGIIALSHLPIAQYSTIMYTAPIFITALSPIFLGDKVGMHRWVGVCLGFLGTLLAVEFQTFEFNIGVIFALLTTISITFIILLTRKMSWTENVLPVIFWYTFLIAVYCIPQLVYYFKALTFTSLLLFIAIGLAAGTAQIFLIQSVHYAPPSVSSPYAYLGILWSIIAGLLIWGEVPAPSVIAGAGCIVFSALYIRHRELKKNKKA